MNRPLTIKELPASERPREKLLNRGAFSVSNAELLAILLRTGTKQENVTRIAERLLADYKDLSGLAALTPRELEQVHGIGPAKAVTLAAAIEFAKRLSAHVPAQRPVIRSPGDAAAIVMPQLRYESKEHFMALLLSTKNHVLAVPVISIGSLNASIVHPRELFREAISHSAASTILVHNHPSGDPTPSPEDISLTRRLVEAGQLLDISVLDHLIIGDGKYVSMKEKGII
jgi:DNA repair protein RadC